MKNVPNIISSFRIALTPVFVAAFVWGGEQGGILAALVFLLAALSDFLDGYLARRFQCTSELGKILDPAGDKLMTLALVACLAHRQIIPEWVLWFFLAKELLTTVGSLFLRGRVVKEVPASNIFGKVTTFSLFTVGLVLMIFDVSRSVATALMVMTVLLATAALLSYALTFAGIWKKHRSN